MNCIDVTRTRIQYGGDLRVNFATIVQKRWNYCNALRDGGMSYGDYVERLTYPLFLKIADERLRPPYKQTSPIPEPYARPALLARDAGAWFNTCRHAPA